MSTKLVNPAGLYDGAPVGMSQAKVDLESGFVFVSGQVDWDGDSRVRHPTLDGQAEGAIEHLATVLTEAGSSLEKVLQLRVYVRGELADGRGHAPLVSHLRCHPIPAELRHEATPRARSGTTRTSSSEGR